MTKQELIDFELEVIKHFEAGKIKAPIHLSDGNEEMLIEIFKMVHKDDWVFSTWRSHYHALLKGIPKEWLMQEILEGRSITINNVENKFFTSAIVGGILPIAVGVAAALKKQNSDRGVWCFIGDMTAETGMFYECLKYSIRHDLPIQFVTEDNKYSVGTHTQETWGLEKQFGPETIQEKTIYYEYEKKFPHVGIGKFITF